MTVQFPLHRLINPHSTWHCFLETEIKAPVFQGLDTMVSCKTQSQIEMDSDWNPRDNSGPHIGKQNWGSKDTPNPGIVA